MENEEQKPEQQKAQELPPEIPKGENGEAGTAKFNGGRPYIVICITEGNAVGVSGSVYDKVLAFGLLEVAKEAINNMHQQKRDRENPGGMISKGLANHIRKWRGKK